MSLRIKLKIQFIEPSFRYTLQEVLYYVKKGGVVNGKPIAFKTLKILQTLSENILKVS